MKLLLTLEEKADRATPIAEKNGGGTLHQLISADDEDDAAEQARAYARALIGAGKLRDTPREFNCHQPTSDHMLLEFFKGAKNTLLIFTGIGHLARQDTFHAELDKAVKNNCGIVICGKTRDVDILLADNPQMKEYMPAPLAMSSAAVQAELQDAAEAARVAQQEARMDVRVKNDVRPMPQIRVIKKPPAP